MSWTQSEFRQAFREDIGNEVAQLVRDSQIDRWVNQAQARLLVYKEQMADVTWAVNAEGVNLPADFRELIEVFTDDGLPVYRLWAKQIRFTRPAEWGGSGSINYLAYWPRITSDTPSELVEEGNQACLSFALYRFYKRLASSRADYRRYSTITQANGVDIGELDELSERHFNDFLDARDAMKVEQATTFFED